MTPDGPAGRTQFLVDPRRTVEATVLLEHRLDFSGDRGILCLPLSRRRPPLPAKLTPLHFDHQGGLMEQSYASLQRGR
jgi:hypothetical protein